MAQEDPEEAPVAEGPAPEEAAAGAARPLGFRAGLFQTLQHGAARGQERVAAGLQHPAAAGLFQTLQAGAARGQERAAAGLQRPAAVLQLAQERIMAAPYLEPARRAHEQIRNANYMELRQQMHAMIKEKAHLDVGSLRAAGYGLPAVGERFEKHKREGQRRLFELGAPVRAKVMFGLLCATKAAATNDPDMCEGVRARISELVGIFWNDLTIFVEQMIEDQKNLTLGKAASTVEELSGMGSRPAVCGPRWWRARILYHYLPYDRSIFGLVKDPVFWLFTVISLLPMYGIRVCWFLLVLLLIVAGSPPDEYQLVSYIIGFKGSQFISSGVIQGLMAAVKYYLCVHPGGTHTCDTDGPGATQDLVSGSIDFLGSCLLTWVAFMWLPCSSRSAGLREAVADASGEAESAAEQPGCCGVTAYDDSKGGRLRGLLGYDLVCFLLSCCLCWVLMYIDATHLRPGGLPPQNVDVTKVLEDAGSWEGHTAIFWGRVFYAMLSFPFVAFLVPGLNAILTHTTATGYNGNGLCVPFMLHPMPEEKVK